MHHQQIGKAQLEIAEELAPLGDGPDNRSEIVVEKHDRGDFPRRGRAAFSMHQEKK